MTKNHLHLGLAGLFSTLFCNPLLAQKLPQVQQESLRATAQFKTDGKATEINNQFKAYNRNTDVYYTMANDDNNLYLILQAKDVVAAKKIIGGGITLTINTTGKKNDVETVSVTFPKLPLGVKSTLGLLITEPETATDAAGKKKQADSIATVMNFALSVNAKEIKVKGVKALADTLLSVYNMDGIKTVIKFDDKRALTYEIALPLKYVTPDNKANKLYYQIKLNGLITETVYIKNPRPNGPVSVTTIPRSLNNGMATYELMNYPTDFWGEYTLIK
jgi:hypothetical protein